MELKNVRTFMHVAELGSFTRAARELGYSQSTVSFQIRQLEDEIGETLFERINRTVKLTASGREVLRFAHKMNELEQTMMRNIRTDEIQGHVRIATADSLATELLQGRYPQFQRAYPGITMEVTTAGTDRMISLMDHNEVDLIYTLDSHIYNNNYQICHEEPVGLHFVTGSGDEMAGRKDIRMEELMQRPLILTEKGMSYRRIWEEWLAARSMELTPALVTGNVEQICLLLADGAGVSLLPDFVTEPYVTDGRLARLDMASEEVWDMVIWRQLLYHKDKWVSPAMEQVIRFCQGSM